MQNRLSKIIAWCGLASRRKAEELICEGRVKVNGCVVRSPQTLVTLGKDQIRVGKRFLKAPEEKQYFLLNKPKGFFCSNVRQHCEKLIFDIFPKGSRLFSAGRLDKDSTGMMIVTNDGEFANNIIHPSSNITKEYIVKVHREPIDKDLKAISDGVTIDNKRCVPVRVEKMRRFTIRIIVKEGKKHEVRKLVEKVGMNVIDLKRTRIGGLRLGTLGIGTYRELSQKERLQILQKI
jgi:23S rRNA pseudouridine2605 synthase